MLFKRLILILKKLLKDIFEGLLGAICLFFSIKTFTHISINAFNFFSLIFSALLSDSPSRSSDFS